ncbi:MAG: UDP-3-O-(3-hydroxymyristoyl)glucosamine N-acyltransferase [Phycisphaerae bacterium]
MGKANKTDVQAPNGKQIGELAKYLTDNGLRVNLVGNPQTVIHRVNTLEDAEPGDITFLANRKYGNLINGTKASAIILPETISGPENLAQIKVDDSYYAMCLIIELIHGHRKHPFSGIDSAAKIDPEAKIAKDAAIGAGVTICRNVIIGTNAVIYPGCFIGPNCTIGDNLLLYPNVTIYDGAVIGSSVTIHAGTVIGEDGFGYATHKGTHRKIPQIGNVIIEDDVEIGAGCAIDRASIGSTIIGKGTKFSNLIAIGHGTKIGPHCLLVAQVGIAGSTKLGHHVTLGGQAGVVGHIVIGNNVTVAAKSGVINNVQDGLTMFGQPALPIQETKRQMVMISKLPEMRDQLKQMQKRIDQMQKNMADPTVKP